MTTNDIRTWIEELDGSTSQRRKAAKEMGRSGNIDVLPLLARLLEDKEGAVVQAAVQSITKIGGKEAVDTVVPLLELQVPAVRNAVVEILERIGGQYHEPLITFVTHEDDDVRKFAIDILGLVGNSSCRTAVEKALGDTDANVRCSAAETLGKLGFKESAEAIFERVEKEQETWVIFHLLESLSTIGNPDLVERMLSIPPVTLGVCQEAMLDAVAEIGSVENFEKLLGHIDGSQPEVSAQLLQAVLRISKRTENTDILKRAAEKWKIKDHLQTLVQHDEMVVRLNALVMLDLIDVLSVEDTEVYLKSPHSDVRLQSLRTLIRLGGENLHQTLLKALDEDDAQIRYEAIGGLAQNWSPDLEETFLDLLKREVTLVQVALVKALGSHPSDRSKDVIQELLINDHPQLRREAETALKQMEMTP